MKRIGLWSLELYEDKQAGDPEECCLRVPNSFSDEQSKTDFVDYVIKKSMECVFCHDCPKSSTLKENVSSRIANVMKRKPALMREV